MLYRVNSSRVMHETIDGETIIIDLENGSYFSLRGTATEIWAHIAGNGSTPDLVAQALAARYAAPGDEIERTVRAFLSELEREQLVVASPSGDRAPALPACTAAPQPFTPPQFEKYTDMQDILLLDPVHEVGDAGWPQAAPAASG